MFAGSGKDAVGNYGSPLILLQEARGEKKYNKFERMVKKINYGT